MMKKISILLLMCLSLWLIGCGSSESGDTEGEGATSDEPKSVSIKMAKATWDTGWFQTAIFQTLLEELGHEVEVVGTLDNAAFYIAVAEGDVDLWANGWFPLHDEYMEDEKTAGKAELVGYQVQAGGLQGYLVDKASAEKYNITSLADLSDPEIAAHFDSDGNGLADLIGCDAGWMCENVIIETIEELELTETVEQRQGTYSALLADTVGRYQRGEPILFYTWTPNWTVSQLKPGEDVVWIEAPIADVAAADGVLGCVTDPCALGFEAADIRVVANSEFLTDNPDIKALLDAVQIPLGDIANQNQLMVDGEDGDEDIARHASEWLSENETMTNEWLDLARAEQ